MRRTVPCLLALALLLPVSTASATDLTSEGGFVFDILDGLGTDSFCTDDYDGSVCNGEVDAWDGGYLLYVNGAQYLPSSPATISGRVITTARVTMGSLSVYRIVYVPTVGNWIRYVDVVENTGAAAASVTFRSETDLGSDSSSVIHASSSGDLSAGTDDTWISTWDGRTTGDTPLAHVFQSMSPMVRASAVTFTTTTPNVVFSFTTMVPAGGRRAVMYFGLQAASIAAAETEAASLVTEPDAIFFGLDAVRGDLINWGPCTATSTCDDGLSCTADRCDTTTGRCVHTGVAGVCNVDGTCVVDGTPNPVNPCQVCNAARTGSAWSPIAAGSTCIAARCSGGRYDPPGTCNSVGTCERPPAVDCPTRTCAGATCEGACTAASCASDEYCSTTTLMCEPLVALGGACTLTLGCESGFCIDGVCCEASCDGVCERCGGGGRCTAVPNGADPDRECAGGDVCDGMGACRVVVAMDAGMPDAFVPVDAPIDLPDAPIGMDAGVDAPVVLDTGDRPDVPFGIDGGVAPPTTRGCTCHVGSGSPAGSIAGLVLVALALIARRR